MTIQAIIKSNIKTLAHNKVRSFLTILGIFIGITSIILIISLGNGAQALILGQVQGLGSKTIIVIPGHQANGPSSAAQTFTDSLKEKELAALSLPANVPGVARITPLVLGGATLLYENTTYTASVYGASEAIGDIFSLEVNDGVFLTPEDVRGRADVAVIGSKVKTELFGEKEAVGERIRIKNRTVRVVGVLPSKGQSSAFNFDEAVIIPYTTGQDYIFGIKHYNRIIIKATDEKQIQTTADDITRTLRNMHDITDPSKDDFSVTTQADIASRLGVITSALKYFLAAVAAISLVVGGVGIMNIMLVSVTERTREIGLRKAIGATDSDILLQFLLEAVMLTFIGGAIGIACGALFSYGASIILTKFVGLDWIYSFPWGASLLGVGVALAVGLIFGIYPARQASKKSPMEALRYE